jgi:hypothetical protein
VRTRLPALTALIALALGLSLACGGSGGGGSNDGPITKDEAQATANNFYMVTLGMFTGDTKAQDLVDLFAPECQESADLQSIDLVISLLQAFGTDLQDIHIEAVDVGPLTLEQTEDGTLITPEDPAQIRVKVDGEFKTADEAFAGTGFTTSSSEDIQPLLLVRRDGKVKIGDCSQLQDISSGPQNS